MWYLKFAEVTMKIILLGCDIIHSGWRNLLSFKMNILPVYTMNMGTIHSSITFVNFNQTAWCFFPKHPLGSSLGYTTQHYETNGLKCFFLNFSLLFNDTINCQNNTVSMIRKDEWTSVQNWCNDMGRRKPKYSEKHQSQCHFAHHKFHMKWSQIQHRSPQWQDVNQWPEPWHTPLTVGKSLLITKW